MDVDLTRPLGEDAFHELGAFEKMRVMAVMKFDEGARQWVPRGASSSGASLSAAAGAGSEPPKLARVTKTKGLLDKLFANEVSEAQYNTVVVTLKHFVWSKGSSLSNETDIEQALQVLAEWKRVAAEQAEKVDVRTLNRVFSTLLSVGSFTESLHIDSLADTAGLQRLTDGVSNVVAFFETLRQREAKVAAKVSRGSGASGMFAGEQRPAVLDRIMPAFERVGLNVSKGSLVLQPSSFPEIMQASSGWDTLFNDRDKGNVQYFDVLYPGHVCAGILFRTCGVVVILNTYPIGAQRAFLSPSSTKAKVESMFTALSKALPISCSVFPDDLPNPSVILQCKDVARFGEGQCQDWALLLAYTFAQNVSEAEVCAAASGAGAGASIGDKVQAVYATLQALEGNPKEYDALLKEIGLL